MDDENRVPGRECLGDPSWMGFIPSDSDIDDYCSLAERYVAERGFDIRIVDTIPRPERWSEQPPAPYVSASDNGWPTVEKPVANIVLECYGDDEISHRSIALVPITDTDLVAKTIIELAGSLEFTEHSDFQGPIPVYLTGEQAEKAKPVLEKRVQELRDKYKIR